MSTEYSWYTYAAGPSGRTASSSPRHSSQAESSTSAGPSTNPSPNHAHNPSRFIESLTLGVVKETKQIPLPGTQDTHVFTGADITKLIKAYESLSSRTGIDLAADDDIAMFPYYYLEVI